MDVAFDFNAAIDKLCGQTLRTLGSHHSFEVLEARGEGLIIRMVRSGRFRTIPREEFARSFERLATVGRVSRVDILLDSAHFNDALFNFYYVAAMLARLPGVTYTTHPIVLWLHKEKQASLLPEG